MAPRGLSAEEKRVKLLEIFHETQDFFQLKELEKMGPKMKGIVSQSVKEVLQSLVDDGLVQGDKIGSSNFFWSFPSQRGAALNARLSTTREANINACKQIEVLKESIAEAKSRRPESAERTEKLETLAVLKGELAGLQSELAAYGACDPARVEEARRGVTLAREAALRWTENFGILLSDFTRMTGVEANEVRKMLDVEDEYEDIL
ncbi:meiotic nuclear division protein 1 [Flagelloscypha sp. PMI_526]|nr:meiotic nuclear division protein 1 [Flagelloscypha sp. PMI_526]